MGNSRRAVLSSKSWRRKHYRKRLLYNIISAPKRLCRPWPRYKESKSSRCPMRDCGSRSSSKLWSTRRTPESAWRSCWRHFERIDKIALAFLGVAFLDLRTHFLRRATKCVLTRIAVGVGSCTFCASERRPSCVFTRRISLDKPGPHHKQSSLQLFFPRELTRRQWVVKSGRQVFLFGACCDPPALRCLPLLSSAYRNLVLGASVGE